MFVSMRVHIRTVTESSGLGSFLKGETASIIANTYKWDKAAFSTKRNVLKFQSMSLSLKGRRMP